MRRPCILILSTVVCASAPACCPCDTPSWSDLRDESPSEQPVEEVDPFAAERRADLEARRRYAPEWSQRDSSQYLVPEIDEAYEVFKALQPTQAEAIDGGLLLCHITVERGPYDTFAGPDLLTDVTIGRQAELNAWGGEDTWAQALSAPKVRLRLNDPIKIQVWDRDVTTTEWIGTAESTFQGNLPFEVGDEHFHATCHVLPPEAIEERLPPRVQAAEEATAAFTAAIAPDPELPNWGFPSAEAGRARDAIIDVAGHVGWADERVRALVAAHDGVQKRWRKVVKDSIARTRKGLAPKGKKVNLDDGDWKVRVDEVSCSTKAKRRWSERRSEDLEANPCFVVLDIERTGPPLEVKTWPGFGDDGQVYAISPEGTNVVMDTIVVQRGKERFPHYTKFEIATGERVQVALETRNDALDVLRSKRATQLIRVRLTSAGTATLMRLDGS